MSYLEFDRDVLNDLQSAMGLEVLLVNKGGCYFNSTLTGCATRKYHGALIVPFKEQHKVLLAALDEELIVQGKETGLGMHFYPGAVQPEGYKYLEHFSWEQVPSWQYKAETFEVRKEVVLDETDPCVLWQYTLKGVQHVTIRLHPFLAYRNIHTLREKSEDIKLCITPISNGFGLQTFSEGPPLYFQFSRPVVFIPVPHWHHHIEYPRERERGYACQEQLFVPGYFELDLRENDKFYIAVGTQRLQEAVGSHFHKEKKKVHACHDLRTCLERAAAQFILQHNSKADVIAGWPWFGRWGRDTFIALPGLTLPQGKTALFKQVVQTMLKDLRHGLFPNTGSGKHASFNSADAPLWFVWAIQQYAYYSNDLTLVWQQYAKPLKSVLQRYGLNKRYGICLHENGLIWIDRNHPAVSWMDAVVDGHAVTPRTGFLVEINALWYNAVCFCAEAAEAGGDMPFAEQCKLRIQDIQKHFLQVFTAPDKAYLADTSDGITSDWSIRPNQVFALSMPFSPLPPEAGEAMLKVIETELLTPRGLRTLSPADVRYQGTYEGNQAQRDNAYHQGTVWPWLMGHYAEACLRVRGTEAIEHLNALYCGFEPALRAYGIGTIGEIFNGNEPHAARGAIAQAWSVAELLRMHYLLQLYRERANILEIADENDQIQSSCAY